jgi:hypothetical protein
MVSSTIIIGIDHRNLLILKGGGRNAALPHFYHPPLLSRYPFTELAEVEKNDIWLLV